ncbi:MAG: hypothetical protein ETSY1_18800 [Candidatus Entotheonella factor]|uniref:Glycosyltransferase subfamily 4-like N-terminal domain-containing protein n=1 Tax=Entotheonella factor TaxID=1429438 RepID=W4LM59_ENTF1|nr:MAG: hypothetical protein ETSY1_18800 [Candidatus Entotheonella factor]
MLLENCGYPEDIRVLLEARSLTEAGYRVAVICPREARQAWYDVLDGVAVYRYPAPPEATSFWGYLWEYGYALTASFAISLGVWLRHGFDIVHAHNPPDLFWLIAAFYKLLPGGVRFVFDHHDLAPEMYTVRFEHGGNRWAHRVLYGLERLSHRLADHVIVVNESYKRIAMTRGRVPESRLTVVRNGPDVALLNAARSEALPVVVEAAEGRTILAYVGVMGYQDGLDYLLRALHHLVHDLGRSDFACVLIGQGDAYADLQATTSALALEDYVIFTGWVDYDQVGSYLQAADICVAPEPSNPYTDLSTTIKMMEYMALGKPIVAFELPEHQWTAREAALYARPNDELEFARHLAALMDDPERRQQMGAYGRNRIETELAWPYQAKHLIEAYAALTARDDDNEMARAT